MEAAVALTISPSPPPSKIPSPPAPVEVVVGVVVVVVEAVKAVEAGDGVEAVEAVAVVVVVVVVVVVLGAGGNVIRAHSLLISVAGWFGFQPSRPHAYVLLAARMCPVTFAKSPMFDTHAIPPPHFARPP
jgi:hypothetical protein